MMRKSIKCCNAGPNGNIKIATFFILYGNTVIRRCCKQIYQSYFTSYMDKPSKNMQKSTSHDKKRNSVTDNSFTELPTGCNTLILHFLALIDKK